MKTDPRQIEEHFVEKYVMIRKSSLYFFLGGFVVALGSATYVGSELAKKAAQEVISSSAAQVATAEVEKLRESAKAKFVEIDERARAAEELVARATNDASSLIRLDALERDLKSMHDSVQSVFDSVATEIGALKAQRGNPGQSTTSYTVQVGDSGSKIADKFFIPMKELERLNPLVEWAKLKVGQKLVVPGR